MKGNITLVGRPGCPGLADVSVHAIATEREGRVIATFVGHDRRFTVVDRRKYYRVATFQTEREICFEQHLVRGEDTVREGDLVGPVFLQDLLAEQSPTGKRAGRRPVVSQFDPGKGAGVELADDDRVANE